MHCCARLYHRTLGRLECGDAQWGGQLILQRSMRGDDPKPVVHFITKTEWDAEQIGFPTLEIDYHAVRSDEVASPAGAGPEGCAFVVFESRFTGSNAAPIPSRAIRSRSIPRFLSPGSPCTTFMAQSSLRAGSSASHLGIAAAAVATVDLSVAKHPQSADRWSCVLE